MSQESPLHFLPGSRHPPGAAEQEWGGAGTGINNPPCPLAGQAEAAAYLLARGHLLPPGHSSPPAELERALEGALFLSLSRRDDKGVFSSSRALGELRALSAPKAKLMALPSTA